MVYFLLLFPQFSSPVPEFDMEDEMCSGFDTSFLEDPNVMFRFVVAVVHVVF